MSVKISKESSLGLGSRGFRFEIKADHIADRKFYDIGRKLEESRFRAGSVAQKMFDRMSSSSTPREDSKKK